MYALEYDPTGTFGRQGSIYDLLADAKQKTARIAINAWGLSDSEGEYTADSNLPTNLSRMSVVFCPFSLSVIGTGLVVRW